MRSKTKKHSLGSPPSAYTKLLARLAQPGWICHGTVVCRPLRRRVEGKWVNKGPYYLWTGKRQGKTICHALSEAQYNAAREAIEAHHHISKTLAQLHAMTLSRILKTVPGVQKRK
jgi:hypothetical protein